MLQLLIPVIGTLIDKIIPDPQAAAQAKLRMLELQQQGALAEAEKELRQAVMILAGSIAHDLRSPISMINMRGSSLQKSLDYLLNM